MRLCSDCDEQYIWFFSFIFEFLSNSCMFSVAVFYFGQVIYCNSKREVMLDCGFSPLMCSLSDRNMRLGDVLLPLGIKQVSLSLRVKGFFILKSKHSFHPQVQA